MTGECDGDVGNRGNEGEGEAVTRNRGNEAELTKSTAGGDEVEGYDGMVGGSTKGEEKGPVF